MFVFCSSKLFAQQDPQLSLYMFDKMALNPAATGMKDALEVTAISREQWLGMQGAPTTNAVLLEAPLNNKNVAWGVELMNDRTGPASNTIVQGNYAYKIKLGNGKLAMGLGIQVSDYAIDWQQIDMPDKSGDLYNANNSVSKILPDAEAGLFYSNQSFYAGLSYAHLLQPKLTTINDANASFSPHAYFIAGYAFRVSQSVLLNPSLVYQWVSNAPSACSINLNALLADRFWVGVSAKLNYGAAFIVAYKASDVFLVGYAYDLGLNGTGNMGSGSHELSLQINLSPKKIVQLSPRFF